jgi:hypothetical protein
MRWIVASLCGYETVAICSRGQLPTLTELDRRAHHAICPVILGGLAVHFYGGWPRKRRA